LDPGDVDASLTRWEPFRKLCRYYADCARTEAGAHVEAFADQEGKAFAVLDGAINWDALASGESVILDAGQMPGPLVARMTSPKAPPLFLGGPVQIWLRGREAYRFMAPLFLIPVRLRIAPHETVAIDPLGPADVNTKWLQDAFRSPGQQREFLEQCGLAVPCLGDSEIPAAPASPTLPDLCRIASMVQSQRWADPGSIYQPARAPAFSELTRQGVYSRVILAFESSKPFTARLRRELLQIAKARDEELDDTALSSLFPHRAPAPGAAAAATPDASPLDVEIDLLNEEQHQACAASMRAPLAVVTGPPGTGKSRVVANAMVRAALAGRSVLLASRNHQALDAVEPKLNELAGCDVFPVRLNRPFGDAQGDPFASVLGRLVTSLATPADLTGFERRIANLKSKAKAVAALRHDLAEANKRFADLEEGEKELDALCQEYPRHDTLFRTPPETPALDSLDSVLAGMCTLCSDGNNRLLMLICRFRRWLFLRRSRAPLVALLGEGLRLLDGIDPSEAELQGRCRLARFRETHAKLATWQPLVLGLKRARATARLRASAHDRRIEDIEAQLVKIRHDTIRATELALHQWPRVLGGDLAQSDKNKLDGVLSAVRNSDNNPEHPVMIRAVKLVRKHFPLLTRHVPLWAATNLSVGRSIPLASAIFDLLIIDEASQCDVASAIPLLFRSKRALIVGDPRQLKFVAALDRDNDYRLRQKHAVADPEPFERFSYRTKSLYGLAETSEHLLPGSKVMLQEHFRCDASICEYFNSAFYQDRLIVLTDSGRLRRPRGSRLGILWTDVEGDARAAPSGGAISHAQEQAITGELRRLVDAGFAGTVGVVTPFRAQANRIRDRAEAMHLPAQWDFVADTADGFQGGERDVILFSLVGGPGMPSGAEWFYENDPNRFNVAVSRARSVLHIFGNKDWTRGWSADNASRRHVALLLAAAEKQRPEADEAGPYAAADFDAGRPRILGDPALIGPVWEPKLADALWARRLPVIQQYPACGRFLDIALLRDGLKLDVEVDGECHRDYGGGRKADDLRRDIALIANEWTVARFWTYELREDFEGCVNRIVRLWEGR
jgi:very-short-patch-repair endonuclease